MTNNVKSLIDDYSADPTGATDCSTALQNAFNAGGTLYIPPGTYKITSPVSMTKVMKVFGAGESSFIKGVFGSAQTGAIKINMSAAPSGFLLLLNDLSSFRVESNNGPAILFDLSSGSYNYANRTTLDKLHLTNTASGPSLSLLNPTNVDGMFCSRISNCWLDGGIYFPKCGDSVTIENNTITSYAGGAGPGIYMDFTAGANLSIIRENNITTTGQAISIGANALNIRIENNNIEHVSGSTDYVVQLNSTKGVTFRGNSINGHSLVTSALIGINNCEDTLIDENLLMECALGVYNTVSCTRTRVGQRNRNSCTTFMADQSASTIVEGSGVNITTTTTNQGTVIVSNKYNGRLSNSTSFTFPAISFGLEDTTRILTVKVWQYSATVQVPSSVTIGGVSCGSYVVQALATGATNVGVTIYKLLVPTGTSGDVVITFPSTVIDCAISVDSIIGASNTVSATASDTTLSGTQLSASLAIPANGAAIGACQGLSTGTMATSWANMSEDYDISVPHGGGTHGCSFSHTTTISAITPTITADITATASYGAMALVAFAPI